MELRVPLKTLCTETAKSLNSRARRLLRARTVQQLGPGDQRRAERALGWNRLTMRTGLHTLTRGFGCLEALSARGRKRAAVHVPALLDDRRAIVDSQRHTDPPCRTQRLYTRLRATEVRRQLMAQQGSQDHELPTVPTLTVTRNARGSFPKKVAQ
ncbi:MAG: ISAzo13 family transposase, partial [Candidatus Tectomicrobia bacterium]|nr:ISAzo13 family transposase [Candidatus Tectomicrobia bacterium]